MSRSRTAVAATSIAVAAGVVLLVVDGESGSTPPGGKSQLTQTKDRRPAKNPHRRTTRAHDWRAAGTPVLKPGSDLLAPPSTPQEGLTELEQLKRSLENYNTACNGWLSPDFQQFVRQSFLRILGTPEMLDVMAWAEAEELRHLSVAIDVVLRRILRNPDAAEQRWKLIQVQPDARWRSIYAMKYCWYAGEGCSREEFESLVEASSDPEVIRNLHLGWNLRLANTEPMAALTSTLAYYHQRRNGASHMLSELIGRLPPTSDFAAMEPLLARGGADEEDLEYHQMSFFQAWASADPGMAANYVLANPERLSPELMGHVLTPFARDQPAAAIAWVQLFPPGQHLDAAVSAVVVQIRETDPDTARALAARISDSEKRATSLDLIERYNSPGPR